MNIYFYKLKNVSHMNTKNAVMKILLKQTDFSHSSWTFCSSRKNNYGKQLTDLATFYSFN